MNDILYNPDLWPHGHYCPVVNKTRSEKEGLTRGLVFRSAPTTVVGLCRHNGWGVNDYITAKREPHASVNGLIEAGWEVD